MGICIDLMYTIHELVLYLLSYTHIATIYMGTRTHIT